MTLSAPGCSSSDEVGVDGADSGNDGSTPDDSGSNDARATDASKLQDGAPLDAAKGPSEIEIFSGGFNSCALLPSGDTKCWGDDISGNLGNGTDDNANHPQATQPVSGDLQATTVGVGFGFTCAVTPTNVKCWGLNILGQLGHNPSLDAADSGCDGLACSRAPVDATGTNGATSVAGGLGFACAVVATKVLCWGLASVGATGPSPTPYTPNEIPLPAGPWDLHTGDDFACARNTSDGTVWCWGGNEFLQLGRAADAGVAATTFDEGAHPEPREVGGLAGTIALATGGEHACAVRADKTVVCWGNNGTASYEANAPAGQLGHDPSADSTCHGGRPCNSVPTAVAGLANVKELALGGEHSCALKDDGSVVCWGLGKYNLLANGALDGSVHITPVAVAGLGMATHIAAGASHSCAVTADQHVACWGRSIYGVAGLGDGGSTSGVIRIEGL